MDKSYIWSYEDVFRTDELWQSTFNEIEKQIDFSFFKGKLNSKKEFLSCMQMYEKISRAIEKLGVYAMMRHDEDTSNSFYDSMNMKVQSLGVKYSTQTAFIVPELTALSKKTLLSYINDRELSNYDYMLKTILKEKKHILSEKEEKLLALSGETLSSFRDIFTKTDNVDLPLKTFKYKGKDYPLSHGAYSVYMKDKDRNLRKKAFNQYYSAYVSLINVISATYAGNVKKDVFISRAKKFNSSLERALSGEDVNPIVYKNLIDSVQKGLPILHKYVAQKKKCLNLKTMYMYDMNMPCVDSYEMQLDYDSAYDLVIEGLSPLGQEYTSLLKRAKEERWLHVYEQKGKRSGAYSVAVYDTHPFVLLNYQKTTHDVFTIAHEMGHSIHSYFSNREQPYSKADYKIFVAEVASTVNEVLLLRYLLDKATDTKEKKYLLSYLMEMIRTTLFRQTQFAEFEQFSHSSVEKGIPLTKDLLNSEYLKLNQKYYGKAVKSEGNIQYEWARIPHFYRAFYVYKYATGIISALSIVDRILNEGQPAIDDYFKFLSSGGKDSPVELLKIAGVDLTKKYPFRKAMQTFQNTLKEFMVL